jgi:hypothetical protein
MLKKKRGEGFYLVIHQSDKANHSQNNNYKKKFKHDHLLQRSKRIKIRKKSINYPNLE